ncbi:MAG: hypothetical protein RIT43_1354 [Bacteroidota bacterium]|jgi:hypothetical protein
MKVFSSGLSVLMITFMLSFSVDAQKTKHDEIKVEAVQTKQISFETYCEQNAIHLMDIPAEKLSGITFAGTLNYIDAKKQPGLKEYGLTPSEKETLYYTLNGSDKILAVQSLFVLRLNYANSKK